MGRPKADLKCKKHPKHRQSPGVCSLCLTEKLSQLSSRRNSETTAGSSCCSSSASSLSSCYSSSSASSSCSSPLRRFRFTKEGKTSSISFLFNGKSVLTKSRSLAFVARMKNGDDDNDDDDYKKKKKKVGFWSKLLHPRSSKRMGETLMHSRTMREMVITS
ncbi:uncharacterized protein LOC132185774 [Corylus avellana]|uniref:uncharacterized protein LOC132185774 n=1 Tax=Corylus avellana TaxID=13451 RepID=UPI001E21859F|nr:uncharacterized protein LOC132185774 [Corylus avellana]